MRDILMLQVAPKGAVELISGAYDSESLRNFAKYMTTEELLCALNTVQNSMSSLRESKNPKTVVELCLISLCDDRTGDSIESLRARISRLERQIDELNQGLSTGEIRIAESAGPAGGFDAPEPRAEAPQFKAQRREIPEVKEEIHALEEKKYITENVAEPVIPEPEGYEMPKGYASYDRYEDEEDANDYPAAFDEDQPEDSLTERENSSSNLSEENIEDLFRKTDDGALWTEICKRIKGIGMDVKLNLSDPRKVHGYIEGHILHIDVIPGFLHKRFEKQEMLERFAKTAREITGDTLQVKLGELVEQERAAHSIEELKEYPEVRFI